MPRVNLCLLVGVLLLVGLFRSSSALASAYGISVTGTMVVTAIMAFVVVHKVWGWSLPATFALIVPFVVVDTTFLGANLLKVVEGGWVPLALACVVMVVMYTWRRGMRLLLEKTRRQETPLDALVAMLEKKPPPHVPGTAVFLTSDPMSAPTALLHSLKHYKVLHDKIVILSIQTDHLPRVPIEERVRIEPVGRNLLAGDAALRLHGSAERAAGACRCAAARLAVRYHVHVVLPVAPRAATCGTFRHAALAGPPVHLACPRRQRRHRLFPDPDRPRGRGRYSSDNLSAAIWSRRSDCTADTPSRIRGHHVGIHQPLIIAAFRPCCSMGRGGGGFSCSACSVVARSAI